jgi:hypothetical protein
MLAQRFGLNGTPSRGVDLIKQKSSSLPLPTNVLLTEGSTRREVIGRPVLRAANKKSVGWQFTTDDAKVRVRSLYPVSELKH